MKSRVVSVCFAAVFCLLAVPVPAQDATVAALGTNQFSPATVTINAGETVRWTGLTLMHNVVEVSQATWNANGSTSNGGFNSGTPGAVTQFDHTFPAPGTFYYVCEPHVVADDMKGIVVVLGAPDETATFDATNDDEDWILTAVSTTDIFSGALPSNEAMLTLELGKRYDFTSVDSVSHDFQLLAKSPTMADIVLLSQGPVVGTLESDAGIAWLDDGNTPSGSITFTLTQDLVDAMNQGGNAPGYRCQQHPTMMRGDIVAVAPGPELSAGSGGGLYEEGQDITLSVTVSGTTGITTYEWFKNGSATPIADGGAISGASTPDLMFAPATVGDTGNYVLTVTDQAKAVANSAPIALTVVAPGSLPVAGIVGLTVLVSAVAGSVFLLRRRR